jgi:membrane-bound serine protease (ClpP class)
MYRIARQLFLIVVVILLPRTAVLQESTSGGRVLVFTIDGAIGPAISTYIQQGISRAEADGDYLVVLQMDTPGGLDTAMRDIIQGILDAEVPVVTYVYPQGARAASAGTYILYASHIAAMAPATNLGAATPVQIGTPSLTGQDDDPEAESASAMEAKMVNDAIAYIRGLAERNGRNAAWAETAVREAASLSASEALAENVINIVATDLDDLLAQIHGRQVTMNGASFTLDMTGKTVRYMEMDWRTSLLTVLTNPSLILILGMIGIYGLIIEFYSPGFGIGGVMGVIFLLVAGYGLQLLPVNYAGLGLIILGIGLMVGEAFMPSFGVLGIGGIIAFTVGGVMLIDTDMDVYQVSLPMLLAIAAFSAIMLAITLRMFMRLRDSKLVSGLQTIIGQTGESLENFTREGMVKVRGEIWQAHTDTPLMQGDAVKVVQVDGLQLTVTKV